MHSATTGEEGNMLLDQTRPIGPGALWAAAVSELTLQFYQLIPDN